MSIPTKTIRRTFLIPLFVLSAVALHGVVREASAQDQAATPAAQASPSPVQAAKATAIGIHFTAASTEYMLAPEDIAGAVPEGNWNNASATSGQVEKLTDSKGGKTNVNVTFASSGANHDDPSRATSPFTKLYGSWLDAVYGGYPPVEGRATAWLENIPYETYDVYVYVYTIGGGKDDYVYQGTTNGVAGDKKLPYTGDAPKEEDGYKEGVNYVKFTGLKGPTQFFLLSNGGNAEGVLNSELAGIEIVNTSHAAAEPAK